MTISANYPAIRPSLLLDFANEQALDPRITFTRSTTGTYYNGYSSAVAEQNLLTYSQAFAPGATSWSAYGGGTVTVTDNVTTAPDGTTTASSLIGGAASGTYKTIVSSNSFSASTAITASIYVKANGYNYLVFVAANGNGRAVIDFATPANNVVYAGSFTITSTPVGSGWYRVTVSFTSGSAAAVWFGSIPTIADPSIAFTSNGTSGIYIWGAQLEQRSSATAYNPTTTTAITNYIPVLQTGAINQARFDHDPVLGTSLGLLIEQQSTNLLTYSSDLTNAIWVKNATTISANSDIAPDGTQTACLVVPSATSNTFYVSNSITKAASATTYTYSGYSLAYGYNFLLFRIDASGANGITGAFNISTGAVSTTFAIAGTGWTLGNATINAVGNGWYRWSVSFTTASETSVRAITWVSNATGSGFAPPTYTGNGFSGLYIWGAQLEALAFSTSYIPTVASQVTRSADSASMTGTNFSSWYNISQGTIYAEALTKNSTTSGVYTISDGGTNNRIDLRMNQGSAVNNIIQVNGTVTANPTSGSASVNSFVKMCTSYATTSAVETYNGSSVTSVSNTALPVVNQMQIGWISNSYLNGTIKKLAYYPIAVSSANLIALTGS